MKKLYRIFTLSLLVIVASCGVDVGYDTSYILKSWVQPQSGDDLQHLDNVRLFGFDADTSAWRVASYEDALVGRITSQDDAGVTLDAEIVGVESDVEGYGKASTMQVKGLSRVMVLAVDTQNRLYGYTQQEISENLPKMYVSLVFHPWKSSSTYKNGAWYMFNDFYVPDIKCRVRPTVQSEEGGESSIIKGLKIYLFKVDNPEQWVPTSFAEAAAGWIKNSTTGETITSTTSFSGDSQGTVTITYKPESYLLLAVESQYQSYGTAVITQEHADSDISLCFMPWRTDSPYTFEQWTLYNTITK